MCATKKGARKLGPPDTTTPHITFHYRVKGKTTKTPRRTGVQCYIRFGGEEYIGESRKHPSDVFDPYVGKLKALRNAARQTTGVLSSVERGEIFERFKLHNKPAAYKMNSAYVKLKSLGFTYTPEKGWSK